MVVASHAPERNRALDRLFPNVDAVVVDAVHHDGGPIPPLDVELAASVDGATDARRREFAIGRRCAAIALAAAGSTDTRVDRHVDRSPIWPAGWTGSIAHSSGYVVAVAARRSDGWGIGIDAEHIDAVDDDVAREVLTPNELAELGGSSVALGRRREATVVFAAKEAFFKAQYPFTGRWVNFSDVELVQHVAAGERSGVATLRAGAATAVLGEFDWPIEARWTLLGEVVVVGVKVARTVVDH